MSLILYDIHKNIAHIQLHRPHKAHAYNTKMLEELSNTWSMIEKTCQVAVISSKGHRAFCGGADLMEIKTKTPEHALTLFSQQIFDRIAQSKILSIAAIHGAAIAGGFELAMACDLRVISASAYFALPEISLGLVPSAGGCTRLSQLTNPSIARSVILGGQSINAEQAMQWGLAHQLSDTPIETALEWAQNCQRHPFLAQQLGKMLLQNPTLEKERMAEAILYGTQSMKNS